MGDSSNTSERNSVIVEDMSLCEGIKTDLKKDLNYRFTQNEVRKRRSIQYRPPETLLTGYRSH